ncbi:aromatic amino acid transaminase [Polynucleobacter rarus]|uniref:amino acid aminotransferase n=1 Tax=Polynucleobacter rarus TaxID=556055 RepID=UPI000D3E914E|nr:amino acid aminotransferase [Polynucleobacter rarus]
MTLFSSVELAPRDPILGLYETFNADTNPNKVNLGVGVYFTEEGKIPLLRAVQVAEKMILENPKARGYLPIEGIAAYNNGVQQLLFSSETEMTGAGRSASFETLGGTGALKVGADFLKRLKPHAKVAISDPSWENHRALFEGAGFEVVNYPYYDPTTRGVNFEAMKAYLTAMPVDSIIVLHACCHNPTGADLSPAQWEEIVTICQKSQLIPFLDLAYQGFADGIYEDGLAVRLFTQSGLSFFIASSFSKSFSLYGERVGALTIVTQSKEETSKVVSQIKRVIRTNYSNPPTHGATIVATVLNDATLRNMWEQELMEMRDRIKAMRELLVKELQAAGANKDFEFIKVQRGMFSYTGLSKEQVDRLINEHSVYAVGTGRICVASLNTKNIKTVAQGIAAVL